jgi:hypothetical protein
VELQAAGALGLDERLAEIGRDLAQAAVARPNWAAPLPSTTC